MRRRRTSQSPLRTIRRTLTTASIASYPRSLRTLTQDTTHQDMSPRPWSSGLSVPIYFSANPTVKNCRIFLVLVLLLFSLAGCDRGRTEELENRVAELEAQLDDVRSKLDAAESEVDSLKSATDELTSAVGDFDYDNWRSVVPDVQQAAANVESATNDVESSIDDAKNAAN